LDPEVVLHLLRIVQEALANVRKHADATQVRVGLHKEDGILTLSIEDDGRGYQPESALRPKDGKFGLLTMHERAREIDASLQIRSNPGVGTRVTVELPVGEERN
jgi:signal transduction histidine kinase